MFQKNPGREVLFWQEPGKKDAVITKYVIDGETFEAPPEAEFEILPGYLVLIFEDGTQQIIPELPEGVSLEDIRASLPPAE